MMIFSPFQYNVLPPNIVVVRGTIAAFLYCVTEDTEFLIASVLHSSTFKTRESLRG
jgi:hypothetical protein